MCDECLNQFVSIEAGDRYHMAHLRQAVYHNQDMSIGTTISCAGGQFCKIVDGDISPSTSWKL